MALKCRRSPNLGTVMLTTEILIVRDVPRVEILIVVPDRGLKDILASSLDPGEGS